MTTRLMLITRPCVCFALRAGRVREDDDHAGLAPERAVACHTGADVMQQAEVRELVG